MDEKETRRLERRRAVGALIQRHRLARGLTQTELGDQVGLSQRYVSKIERGGVQMPGDDLLEDIGDVLGLTLGDFYAARGLLPQQPPTPQPEVGTGIRDEVDAAIVGDLLSMVGKLADHEALDTLREMREMRRAEPSDFYDEAIGSLSHAMAANFRRGGELLRIPPPAREGDG